MEHPEYRRRLLRGERLWRNAGTAVWLLFLLAWVSASAAGMAAAGASAGGWEFAVAGCVVIGALFITDRRLAGYLEAVGEDALLDRGEDLPVFPVIAGAETELTEQVARVLLRALEGGLPGYSPGGVPKWWRFLGRLALHLRLRLRITTPCTRAVLARLTVHAVKRVLPDWEDVMYEMRGDTSADTRRLPHGHSG